MFAYTTPVSVDHFGDYPGYKPGDTFSGMYEGKVYIGVIADGAPIRRSNGTLLRDAHIQQVEGPVTRQWMPFEVRHSNWRKYTQPRKR